MKPVPRNGVGLATTQNGIAYTFGGVIDLEEDEEHVLGCFSNEMHSFDLAKQTWRLVEYKSHAQKAAGKDQEVAEAAQPVEAVSDDGVFRMVVGASGRPTFTGVFGQAPKPTQSVGNVPMPRMKASLVVCKKNLYLYGGSIEEDTKQLTLSDFYSIGKNQHGI